jgi:hypothetical protein
VHCAGAVAVATRTPPAPAPAPLTRNSYQPGLPPPPAGDPLRYFFAAVTIAIGLLHLVVGCIWRLSPRPFIDCTSGEEGPGTAPRAGAATPVVSSTGGGKTTAGQAAFGDNGATAPPMQSNPFAPNDGGGGTGAAKK